MITLETRPPEADPLAQLDAELDAGRICECRCASFPDRHGPARCTREATFYVEMHRFGHCQLPELKASPDVTDDGDKCSYLCRECKDSATAFAQAFLSRLPARAVCPPWPAGQGCGRVVVELDDLMPVRRPL